MTTESYKPARAKLRESSVRQILELRAAGGPAGTYQRIAEQMGVSIGTIYNICNGVTWGFVKAEFDAEVLAKKAAATL